MDPNANLQEQLELSKGILETYHDEGRVDIDVAARLAELVEALNNWLARGGFPPTWKEVI